MTTEPVEPPDQTAASTPMLGKAPTTAPTADAGWAAGTLVVTAGRPSPAAGAPVNPPVVLSSTYHAGDPNRVYDRFGNDTWEAFETALGALEGGSALLWGSGMAAISAVLGQVPVGGVVVLPDHAYSGTAGLVDQLVTQGRIACRRVDIADTSAVTAAVDGAHLLWLETPTNPMLEVADLPATIEAAHRAGALAAVDNTFSTPLVLRPLEHGADVVVHSVTKYLAGHSDVVLGATVCRDLDLRARLHTHRTLHGAVPGPWEAWLALRGLRTLALRVEHSSASAAVLAERLQQHPAVTRVRYPGLRTDPGHTRASAQMDGFGAIVSIEVAGGAAAEQVAAAVRLWTHATSLGGVESTIERRRRHAAEAITVPDGLLRLSVGIEDADDLWADLAAALDSITTEPPAT